MRSVRTARDSAAHVAGTDLMRAPVPSLAVPVKNWLTPGNACRGAGQLAHARDAGMIFGCDRDSRHPPPAAALFLRRKLGGLYLLAARLKARVDVREVAEGFLAQPE